MNVVTIANQCQFVRFVRGKAEGHKLVAGRVIAEGHNVAVLDIRERGRVHRNVTDARGIGFLDEDHGRGKCQVDSETSTLAVPVATMP